MEYDRSSRRVAMSDDEKEKKAKKTVDWSNAVVGAQQTEWEKRLLGDLVGPNLLPTNYDSLFGNSTLASSLTSLGLAYDPVLSEKHRTLSAELSELQKTFERQRRELNDAVAGSEQQKEQIRALEATIREFTAKEQLGFVLVRVRPEARRVLLESNELRDQFLGDTKCNSFVISVDIRRSTELMLKARTPEDFARFTLSGQLKTDN
jgi:hypothetical protein